MTWVKRWRVKAAELQREVHTLYLVSRDPRVDWQLKALAAGLVAYAVSPIDLIPDFIPVLGALDDLVIVPLGIWFLIKLVPDKIMADNRKKAKEQQHSRAGLKAVGLILFVRWLFCLAALYITTRWMHQTYQLHLGKG